MIVRRFMDGNYPPGMEESNGPMWVVELGPANFIVWALNEEGAEEAVNEILDELNDIGPGFHPALVSIEQ